MDRRLAALVVLLVAVPLVAAPLYAFPTAGQPAYAHTIEPITEDEIPADVTVRPYADLSPEAQQAIDAALASDDGSAVVRGEANEPPEFFYSDTVTWGEGRYVIEQGGDYYELTTLGTGGIDFSPLTERLLQLLGLFVGAVGVAGVRYDRERAAVAVAGVASVPLASTAAHSAGLVEADALALLSTLGALCVAVVAVGWVTPRRVAVGVTGVLAVGAVGVVAATGFDLLVASPPVLLAALGTAVAFVTDDPTQPAR